MIIHSTYNKQGECNDYKIYENEQEFKESGIKTVSIENAVKGDYVKTHNGYYVPITFRTDKKTKKGNIFMKLGYPGGLYANTWYGSGEKLRSGVYMYYHREGHKPNRMAKLSNHEKLVVNFVLTGMDLEDAFRAVYKTNNYKTMSQKLAKMLQKKAFLDFLKENGQMGQLKDQLDNHGANSSWFAKFLKETIEDKKASAALKNKCIDIIYDQMGDKAKKSVNEPMITSKEDINESLNDIISN